MIFIRSIEIQMFLLEKITYEKAMSAGKIIGPTLSFLFNTQRAKTSLRPVSRGCTIVTLNDVTMSIMASQITGNSTVTICLGLYHRKKIKARVTSPLWGESTDHRWIPLAITSTRGSVPISYESWWHCLCVTTALKYQIPNNKHH